MTDAYALIGKMHAACTQIRLAIAVLEKEVPAGESTVERLDAAVALIREVQAEMKAC